MILKYLSENWAPLLILIVALGVLAAIVTSILMNREKEKRDEEYAKMLCDVPIENVATDGDFDGYSIENEDGEEDDFFSTGDDDEFEGSDNDLFDGIDDEF